MNKREVGAQGERIAEQVLKKERMRVIERNFHAYRFGEIDLIAEDGEFLVFAEVKLRDNGKFGLGREAVTKAKQANIRKAAEVYLMKRHITDRRCRYDVIEITVLDGKTETELIKNAF